MGSVASIERYRFGPFELVITGRATSASAIWPWRSIGAACGGAARELYEQALVAAREHGRSWETGSVLNLVGRAERDEGLHDLALKHLVEGITILHALGNRPGVIESLEGLAGLAAATAAPRRAARLWGAAEALRQEIGNARSVHESIAYERQVKPVCAILTGEAFEQAWDEGRAMSLDEAVRYALNEQAGRETN